MSTKVYGVTPNGFVAKQQQDIILEMQSALQIAFGRNLNFAPRSIFSQLVGIFSEREALVWQLAEGVFHSQYPGGAEGTSVDNILALTNQERLKARATTTAPTDSSGNPGLVLRGTAGTVIPAGSLIQVPGNAQIPSFSLTADVTIAAAQNCQQSVYFSNTPTTGTWTLSIVDSYGNTLTTSALAYNATAADVQAAIRALVDTVQLPNVTPYSDVTVTGSIAAGFIIIFGGAAPTGANPASGNQPQSLMTVTRTLLQAGATVTNVNVVMSQVGALAQGVGTAVCTQNGPFSVLAGQLTQIASSVAGWSSVTNPLDCIQGAYVEEDPDALLRRSETLAAQANGPIQAIVQKVKAVQNITACVGFINPYMTAQQVLSFSATPAAGSYVLSINSLNTAPLAYNATAAAVQAAVRALFGFSAAIVTGNNTSGFTFDFQGANGGYVPLMVVPTNTTGVVMTPSWGRPGKSFEIVALGGADTDIAKAIYSSAPGGIESYGSSSQLVTDDFGNSYTIKFSRPTQVPIYVSITLQTDLLTSYQPKFNPALIPTIQKDVVDIGNEVSVGGLIVTFGSNGLMGAFNDVPGIISYTMNVGIAPSPTGNANIQLLPEQVPEFQEYLVAVNYV